MSKNNLHVLFDDDDILLEAIKKIREKKSLGQPAGKPRRVKNVKRRKK